MLLSMLNLTDAVLVEDQIDNVTYRNPRFREDFGPFKDGETVWCLSFDFVTGMVQEYGPKGELERSCRFRLAPIDD